MCRKIRCDENLEKFWKLNKALTMLDPFCDAAGKAAIMMEEAGAWGAAGGGVVQSLALRQLLKLQGKGRQRPPPSHLCARHPHTTSIIVRHFFEF